MSAVFLTNQMHHTRVLVGDSVWENASVTLYDGKLRIEFEADDLDPIMVPLAELLAKPLEEK